MEQGGEAACADEFDFLELLIANDRVHRWLEELVSAGPISRKKQLILELRAAVVDGKGTYAEEARKAGVVQTLAGMLGRTGTGVPCFPELAEDEEVMEAISQIMTACSGVMACGGKVRDFNYDGVVVRIKEGALGDGLGARVWTVAHMMCRELTGHRQVVKGKRVLEIGAGCGVCGILAAKLGAAEVVMSDVELPVLHNLRVCVQLNATSSSPSPAAPGTSQQAPLSMDDEAIFDDAESVDDLDLGAMMLDDPAPEPPGCIGSSGSSWDADNMKVRLVDWMESMQLLDAAAAATTAACGISGVSVECSSMEDAQDDLEMPPGVAQDETFEVVIGTDIIYEPLHAQLVASVVCHRLAKGGLCLLCCAVREQKTFDLWRSECARRGLRYRHLQVTPCTEHGGILGREDDYEGGFLFVALDHVDSPCHHWHRDDFHLV